MTRYIGLLVLMVILILCGLWQPHDPDHVDIANRFANHSFSHPMGTDHLGRDLLARVMVGGWRTGCVILYVALVGFLFGTVPGILSAILGGWRERLFMRFTQLFILVPTLILALSISAIFGLTPMTGGLAIGFAHMGQQAIFANGMTRHMLARPFVKAAVGLGVSNRRLMIDHVLPNIMPGLLTYLGNQMGSAAVSYASLSFIGLGVDPSKPDWGGMLFEYRMFIFDHPNLMMWPGVALAATAFLLHHTFDRA